MQFKISFNHSIRSKNASHRNKCTSFFWILSITLASLFSLGSSLIGTAISLGATVATLSDLKELHIQTVLVENGYSRVLIVTPKNLYDNSVALVTDRIEELSGLEVETIDADTAHLELLLQQNVIAFGNMAENKFIRELYFQYYALTDLKYPGKGGHVLRSIHNPLGFGHNVVLVGGSDSAGVEISAVNFSNTLRPGEPLAVDSLMDIALGEGVVAPEFDPESIEATVRSWRDSFRYLESGKTIGYQPAGFFGWNSISIAGMLYYMTGEEKYLETFKRFVFPGSNPPAARIRAEESFFNPENPLVENYHYRSHLLDIVWDLIEEDDRFSDEERLYITNKLLERQQYYDPDDTYTYRSSRHGFWHMMNIYTGSRYFNAYYPSPRWSKRLTNIRAGFGSLINNPIWGERDTLMWVSTSIEPILEFYIMDGADEFVNSGTAQDMMHALDILYSGKEVDDANQYTSISLLHKAAWLLNSPRYAWMAKRFGYALDKFRIGQSYWPTFTDIPDPFELVRSLQMYSLAETDWQRNGKAVARDEAFQILSYRSGLEADDDYLLVDGFAGMGRNPYHLGAITELRLFGKTILSGYENDVDISVDGLVEKKVARAAALKKTFSQDGVAYLQLTVPNMPGCSWDRYILFLDDQFALIADDITPLRGGTFDLAVGWHLGGSYSLKREDLAHMDAGPFVQTSWYPFSATGNENLVQQVSHIMSQGESETAFTRITSTDPLSKMTSHAPKTLTVSGMRPAYVKIGPEERDDLQIEAEFTYVDPQRICLVDATQFSYKGQTFFSSTTPKTGCWELEGGKLRQLDSENQLISEESSHDGATSTDQIFLEDMVQDFGVSGSQHLDSPSEWKLLFGHPAAAKTSVDGTIDTTIAASKMAVAGSDNAVYFTSKSGDTTNIYQLSSSGDAAKAESLPCSVLSLWTAQTQKQKEQFSLLAGCADDTLRAYGEDGSEMWSVTANIHPSFIVGERYEAPWFTDPEPPYQKKGITTLEVGDFWQSGTEYIAVGRPSTVEIYTLEGVLHCSVPIRWGDVSGIASVAHAGNDRLPLLLVAKNPTGYPGLSVIDGSCSNISDNYFSYITEEYEDMHAWLQRGLTHMLVEDIDGDGTEELVYTLSGHWNEIRVYDVESLALEWMHSFGPGQPLSDYVRGLAVSDLDQDGKKEIVTGAETGWLYVFDHSGELQYSSKQSSAITGLAVAPSLQEVAIGLEDDPVLLLGPNYQRRSMGEESRSATFVQWINDDLYVGRKDEVVKYNIH